MLTITVSYGENARRYFKDGLSKEGTYFFGKNIKAYWSGKTSRILGIEGKEVTEEAFSRLSKRYHPEIEGLRLTQRNNQRARAGVDFTVSAPKCFSILYSLIKSEALLEVHKMANEAAMIEAEKLICVQRNTRHERGYINTSNGVRASFLHFLNRGEEIEIDGVKTVVGMPNVHTHNFWMPISYNSEAERYEALEVFKMHMNSDYVRSIYHSKLGMGLERLGYQVERDGSFVKLAGIDRSIVEKFSSRSLEINKIALEKNLTAQQKGELGKLTRKSKGQMRLSDEQLYEQWLAKVSKDELKHLKALKGKRFGRQPKITAKEAVDRAFEHFFERDSVINEKKAIAYAAQLGYGQLTIEEITNELNSRENVLRTERDAIDLITLRELIYEEDEMCVRAISGKGQNVPCDSKLLPVPKFFNDQQKKAVKETLESRDRVTILSGAAGTGKSTVFAHLNKFYKKTGKDLIAITPTTQASMALAEKGIESYTVAALLNNPKIAERLPNNVALVDEAGMIGLKNMNAILGLGQNKTRIILSGDTRQLGPPAQYGDALRILEKQTRLKVSRVDKIMRQRNAPEYLSAVQDLAKGNVRRGFNRLDRCGDVIEINDNSLRIEKIAQEVVDGLAKKRTPLVVSPTHVEVDLINKAVVSLAKAKNLIHHQDKNFQSLKDASLTAAQKKDIFSYQKNQVIRFSRNQTGFKAGSHHEVIDITKDHKVKVRDLKTGVVSILPHHTSEHFGVYTKKELRLSKGQKIRLTNNTMSLEGTKMANGTAYEIRDFNKRGIVLSNKKTIPNDIFHIAPAYASTTFAAQGLDSQKVIVSMSELSQGGINEQAFYVAVSRGTKEVKIYTSDKDSLKKAINRSTERLRANDVAKDHHQHKLQRQKRSYQKNLEEKIKTHEKIQGRQKTPSRGFSQDHARG